MDQINRSWASLLVAAHQPKLLSKSNTEEYKRRTEYIRMIRYWAKCFYTFFDDHRSQGVWLFVMICNHFRYAGLFFTSVEGMIPSRHRDYRWYYNSSLGMYTFWYLHDYWPILLTCMRTPRVDKFSSANVMTSFCRTYKASPATEIGYKDRNIFVDLLLGKPF